MNAKVIAVSGVKNSGKTTFIEGLLPQLQARGLRVAVIKHDAHSFEPDVEGTDSWRMRRAGACGVAVYCDTHFLLVREGETSVDTLCAMFPDADVILYEGGKASDYPKIEVVRAANSRRCVCKPATLLAVATDVPGAFPALKIGLCDYAAAADLILAQLHNC